MEYLMIIPIVAIIYGWIKATPARPHSPDLMPLRSGYDFYSEDDCSSNAFEIYDNDFDSDTSLTNLDFDSDNSSGGHSSLVDDLMFDPANSWYGANIYHNDD